MTCNLFLKGALPKTFGVCLLKFFQVPMCAVSRKCLELALPKIFEEII